MGIQGLIPFLSKSSERVNVRDFCGSTVAIDAYCWLHKGAFGCAEKLVRGEPTDFLVQYCLKRINLLLSLKIKPILVFDGQHLPSKLETEASRRDQREKYLKSLKIFLQQGKIKEARECYQRCVDITPEMAHEVVLACKKIGVDCIIAPYEADAQLAYLNLTGIAQIVITEDSDLLLFGCEKVLFKMDSEGEGLLITKNRIYQSLGNSTEKFTFEKFRHACILSGCDYLKSLPGIGLAKSMKFFSLITNPDMNFALSKIPTYLKMPQLTNLVTKEYKDGFLRANNTFLYQLVFCPMKKELVPLNEYPTGLHGGSLEYAGKYFPNSLALGIATGTINFKTKKPFSLIDKFGENNIPHKYKNKLASIWSVDFQPNKYCEAATTKVFDTCTKGKILVADTSSISLKKRTINESIFEDKNGDNTSDSILKRFKPHNSGCVDQNLMKLYCPMKDLKSKEAGNTPNLEQSSPSSECIQFSLTSNEKCKTLVTPPNNPFSIKCEKKLVANSSSRFFKTKTSALNDNSSILDDIEKESETVSSSPLVNGTQRTGDIFTKLNKFAWNSTMDENKPAIFASPATRASFKPVEIINQKIISTCSPFDKYISQSCEEETKITNKVIDKKFENNDNPRTKKKYISCRVSGLSKKQGMGNITNGQLCLKDMLNNFRYKK